MELYPIIKFIQLKNSDDDNSVKAELLEKLATADAAKLVADYISITYKDYENFTLIYAYFKDKKIEQKDTYTTNYEKLKSTYSKYKGSSPHQIEKQAASNTIIYDIDEINNSIKYLPFKSIQKRLNSLIESYNKQILKLNNENDPILNQIDKWWKDPMAKIRELPYRDTIHLLEEVNKIKDDTAIFTKDIKTLLKDKILEYFNTWNTQHNIKEDKWTLEKDKSLTFLQIKYTTKLVDKNILADVNAANQILKLINYHK